MAGDRPLALVTGASGGIGHALAGQFAEHGRDLVVNAEDGRLEHARAGCGRPAPRSVPCRPASGRGRCRPAGRRDDRPDTDVAVLETGSGRGGAFTDTDLDDDLSVAELYATSTVRLAEPPPRGMGRRGTGLVAVPARTDGHRRGPAVTGSLETRAQGLANKVLPDRSKAATRRSTTERGTAGDDGPRAPGTPVTRSVRLRWPPGGRRRRV
ncbi:hypothetical protein [Streptomyces sp. NPDC001056]